MEQVHTRSPRLWLEMTWVGCFALLSLGRRSLARHHFICSLLLIIGSAATATTLIPVTTCRMTQARVCHVNFHGCFAADRLAANPQFCVSSNAVIATNWITTITCTVKLSIPKKA
jgi:hypothetical protein